MKHWVTVTIKTRPANRCKTSWFYS